LIRTPAPNLISSTRHFKISFSLAERLEIFPEAVERFSLHICSTLSAIAVSYVASDQVDEWLREGNMLRNIN